MKVKDLIDFLKDQDPEAVIVLSSDAEGNSYSELNDAVEYYWDENSQDITGEFEEDSCLQKAIVFWPN